MTCKVCLITEPEKYLLKLCNCKHLIHVECFNKWHTFRNNINRSKCEICNKKYKLNEKCHGIFGLGSKPILDERYIFLAMIYIPFHYLLVLHYKNIKIWKDYKWLLIICKHKEFVNYYLNMIF